MQRVGPTTAVDATPTSLTLVETTSQISALQEVGGSEGERGGEREKEGESEREKEGERGRRKERVRGRKRGREGEGRRE